MVVKTRFAPSPTGMLHVGNVRTALVNWLFTRKMKGNFMLRMDDTDLQRSKVEYENAIIQDLNWLGVSWDSFVRQSERMKRYEEVKEHLIKIGRLYPCYETQEELDMKRKMLLSRGLPPIYDRAALKKSNISENRSPHYRFLLNDETIKWNDIIRGDIEFQAKNISDPIVIREDGSMTYILCSAIDDIDFEITHILRGEDHITNTAIGIQITKALGANPPEIGHTSLLQSKTGEISKRLGGFDIRSLQENFIEPLAICSLLAKMGTSDSTEIASNMKALIDEFDTSKFSPSAVNYDYNELLQLNHKLVSNYSYEEASNSLKRLDIEVTEEFWLAFRGNINTIKEIKDWWIICFENIKPIIKEEDREFLQSAAKLLPSDNWDINTWDIWVKEIKSRLGRSGKSLFLPIRLALTGLDHGPEMKYLLKFIGRERIEKRLNA